MTHFKKDSRRNSKKPIVTVSKSSERTTRKSKTKRSPCDIDGKKNPVVVTKKSTIKKKVEMDKPIGYDFDGSPHTKTLKTVDNLDEMLGDSLTFLKKSRPTPVKCKILSNLKDKKIHKKVSKTEETVKPEKTKKRKPSESIPNKSRKVARIDEGHMDKKLDPTSVSKNADNDNADESLNKTEKIASTAAEQEEKEKRTAFVGNLPLGTDKKKLRALFLRCGSIESVRIRGAVGKKSSAIGKRIAGITKKFHENVKSIYAYVVFKHHSGVENAIKLNGANIDGFCIRVDACGNENEHNNKFTVFLGNLSYDITENALREHFSQCDAIESVRVVRDNKTGKGKGFGYIKFKSSSGFCLAMKMHESMCEGRSIRVKAATTNNAAPNKPTHGKPMKKKIKPIKENKVTKQAAPKTGISQATNRVKSSFPAQKKVKKFKKRNFDKTTIKNKVAAKVVSGKNKPLPRLNKAKKVTKRT